MGVSLFRRKRPQPGPTPAPSALPAGPAVSPDGKERMTANEWAKKLALNEVAAERAAMRAGRWHDLFTEGEFMELLSKSDV